MQDPGARSKTSAQSSALLAADVGNSRTKFGMFAASESSKTAAALPECLESWAVPHQETIDWSAIRERLAAREAQHVAGFVAGANPDGVVRLLSTWPRDGWSPPRVIDDPSAFPIEVRLEAPRKVGIDRLLNAVAANVIRPNGAPCIIVDTGTATTVDAVSADGAFEGGAILPGFELSARALHRYTALLPYITTDELVTRRRISRSSGA
jgi:type III pantothenate kinase